MPDSNLPLAIKVDAAFATATQAWSPVMARRFQALRCVNFRLEDHVAEGGVVTTVTVPA